VRALIVLAVAFVLAAASPMTALGVTPVPGVSPGSPIITNNASAGRQNDPHVSGDLAVYTDQSGFPQIRYYNFATNLDSVIDNHLPNGDIAFDVLSDVNGPNVVFTGEGGGGGHIMVFDTTTSTLTEVDPAPAPQRLGAAIGANTVAYVDISASGDIIAWDLATSTRQVVSAAPPSSRTPTCHPTAT
jgi:hypothetical protein